MIHNLVETYDKHFHNVVRAPLLAPRSSPPNLTHGPFRRLQCELDISAQRPQPRACAAHLRCNVASFTRVPLRPPPT